MAKGVKGVNGESGESGENGEKGTTAARGARGASGPGGAGGASRTVGAGGARGAKDPRTGLTAKQARFCEEYIVDVNGKRAAMRAGVAEKSAAVMACKWLALEGVRAYVDELKAARRVRTDRQADAVLAALFDAALTDMTAVDAEGNTTAGAGFNWTHKLRAIDLALRHLGPDEDAAGDDEAGAAADGRGAGRALQDLQAELDKLIGAAS